MMLGTLLKKELYELNRSFFYDAKKGKRAADHADHQNDICNNQRNRGSL